MTVEAEKGRIILLFVRHGQTQDNLDRILQGQRDTSLTTKGHEQANALAQKLSSREIDVVYHSPLIRMVETIQPILKGHSVEVYPDADLMGQALGVLEGGSYDMIDMGDPRSADSHSGVEVFDDFVKRLKEVLGRILVAEVGKLQGRDRGVVIATHGVGITSLFKALESSPPCDRFNPKLAVRGPEAYEVRWTDSDDIAEIVVEDPEKLPIEEGIFDWDTVVGQPFVIKRWGKKEKAI